MDAHLLRPAQPTKLRKHTLLNPFCFSRSHPRSMPHLMPAFLTVFATTNQAKASELVSSNKFSAANLQTKCRAPHLVLRSGVGFSV